MSIFQKIGKWVRKALQSEFEFLRDNSALAVKATNILKDMIESPLLPMVVAITKTQVDDRIYQKLKVIIPMVAMEMSLAADILKNATAQQEAVAEFVEHLRSLHPDARAKFYVEFAGRVNVALADGKLTFAEGAGLAQLMFAELFPGK